MVIFFLGICQKQTSPPPRIAFRMTDTALVGGTCVDIRKSMSRFVDAYGVVANYVTIFIQHGFYSIFPLKIRMHILLLSLNFQCAFSP